MREFRVAAGATELLLIRHADAEHPSGAPEGEIRDIDLPLSARGHTQAKKLAARLAHRRIDAIVASPLKRTMQTAEAIAALAHHPVAQDSRLREIEIAGIGSVSLSDLADIAIERGGWSHLPGTEGSAQVRARMTAAINDIVAAHPGKRIAIVSHAGAINAYFAHLLGLERDFFFPAGNTSISSVRARDERRLVVGLNDVAHLEREA
jgi:probable phosphoglycerate mutase